jgi:hypothetical protein
VPKLNPVKSAPWFLIAQAAVQAGEHWKRLSASERSKLQKLVKKSRGLPRNLTPKERDELKRLVGKLDLPGLGRDMLPIAGRRRRRR